MGSPHVSTWIQGSTGGHGFESISVCHRLGSSSVYVIQVITICAIPNLSASPFKANSSALHLQIHLAFRANNISDAVKGTAPVLPRDLF